MFQIISLIYCNIKNKETSNYKIILKSITKNIQANEEINKLEDSWGNPEEPSSLEHMMNIPYDRSDIQEIPNQVCNCDEIGYSTNVKWKHSMSNYKCFR